MRTRSVNFRNRCRSILPSDSRWDLPMMTLDSASPYIAPSSPCVSCNTLPGCASSELTAQCTDQCVVIVCNDPDHGEASCSGAQYVQCDPTCDEIYGCSDCYGLDALVSLYLDSRGPWPYLTSVLQLHCYDDYQQKVGESRLDTPPFVWNPALDDFWCACGQSNAPKSPVSQRRSADTPPDISLSPLGQIDVAQTAFQVDPYSPPGFLKTQYVHGCMWGNCTSSFLSLSELRDHVVLVHLGFSPAADSTPNHNMTPQYSSQRSLDTHCLWSECDNPYQSHSHFTSPQSLYKHLMSDHLGVWSPVQDDSSQLPTPTEPATKDTFNEMSHHGSTSEADISQNDSSYSNSKPKILASPEDCSAATHRCCWTGCSFYFRTCDELTMHITSDHIGGGKAHYDCFWEGCSRNGGQGFQSKQKICRHVQVIASYAPLLRQ